MAEAYKISDQHAMYFITCTVHQWADVFTRTEYKEIIIESLKFCQREKGLQIYSWVIMTNHIHLIACSDKNKLSDIIRDFKKYTATQIIKAIENNEKESRKNWLLWLLKRNDKVLFWQEGYHGEEIRNLSFYRSKESYIHLNPVRAGIVTKEEDYLYSSCSERYGLTKGKLVLAEI